MSQTGHVRIMLAVAVVLMIAMPRGSVRAQSNPYHLVEDWVKVPQTRKLGSVIAVDVDRRGSVWAFERCGADTCGFECGPHPQI